MSPILRRRVSAVSKDEARARRPPRVICDSHGFVRTLCLITDSGGKVSLLGKPKPQFRYRFLVQLLREIRGASVALHALAFAITLSCCGSPAAAAGIHLLDADPALSGAI